MNNDSNSNNLTEQNNVLQTNQDVVVEQPQVSNQESVSPVAVEQVPVQLAQQENAVATQEPQVNNQESVSPVAVEQVPVQPAQQENAVATQEPQVSNQEVSNITNVQSDVQNNVSNDLGNTKKSSNKMVIIIVVILIVAAIVAAWVFVFNKPSSDGKSNSKDSTKDTVSLDDAKLLEDVTFNGYGCLNSKCTLSVDDGNDSGEYEYTKKNGSKEDNDILLAIDDYKDYVKVDVYYTEKGNTKTIVDYKIFSKDSGEEIKNVKTEEELRNALGLFPVGSNSSELTLLEIGEVEEWFSFDDEDNPIEYTLIKYKFADSNNNPYVMEYRNPREEDKNLVVGNKYTVKFEVTNETGYEYNIVTIE